MGDFDYEWMRSIKTASNNFRLLFHRNRDRFSCEECLINLTCAFNDNAINRDSFSGLNQYFVTNFKFREFDKLAHFDDFMHLLSGFVCAAFGFDFARIIQRKKGPCAVTLAAIFGLMFAVTIAAGWEFYEFLMDTLHGTNLQLAKAGPETAMFDLAKYHGEYGYIGLVDTMTDMMMNVVGGIVGMIFMIVLRTKGNKKPAAKAKK